MVNVDGVGTERRRDAVAALPTAWLKRDLSGTPEVSRPVHEAHMKIESLAFDD